MACFKPASPSPRRGCFRDSEWGKRYTLTLSPAAMLSLAVTIVPLLTSAVHAFPTVSRTSWHSMSSTAQQPPALGSAIHIGGNTSAVVVTGTLALVGFGQSVALVDVSSPNLPAVLDVLGPLPSAVRVITAGRAAWYVATADRVLRTVRRSQSGALSELSQVDSRGIVSQLIPYGDRLLLAAAADAGLVVFGLDSNGVPSEVGWLDTPGVARSIAIEGTYAYIADGESGLRIVDISEPTSPKELASYGQKYAWATVGPSHRLYASTYGSGPAGIDTLALDDPLVPVKETGTSLEASNTVTRLVVAHGRMYGIVIGKGIIFFQVQETGELVNPGWLPGIQTAQDIGAGDDVVAVAGPTGLRMFGVAADPLAEVGHYMSIDRVLNFAVSDGFLLTSDSVTDLRITRRDAPTRWPPAVDAGMRSASAIAMGPGVFFVAYSLLDEPGAAATEHGIRAATLSETGKLTILGRIRTDSVTTDMVVEGTLLYVVDSNAALRIIDVSQPTQMRELNRIASDNQAWAVVLSGQHAYVAGGEDGLRVIDVSNPSAPRQISQLDTPGQARSIAVEGTYAYIADGEEGLRIIDISDPSAPAEVGALEEYKGAIEVLASRAALFLTSRSATVTVFSLNNPRQPESRSSYRAACSVAHSLVLDGSNLMAATGDCGVIQMRLSSPLSIWMPLLVRNR